MRKLLAASVAITLGFAALVSLASAVLRSGEHFEPAELQRVSLNELGFMLGQIVTPTAATTGQLTVSDATPRRGQTITVSGTGFAPNVQVRITIHSHISLLATARSTATGALQVNITIPADAHLGAHQLRATGTNRGGFPHTLSANITVQDVTAAQTPAPAPVATPRPTGNTLPKTGPTIAIALATIASALVVGGSVLRGWSRQHDDGSA